MNLDIKIRPTHIDEDIQKIIEKIYPFYKTTSKTVYKETKVPRSKETPQEALFHEAICEGIFPNKNAPQEVFYEEACKNLLKAIVLYVYYKVPPHEQTLTKVIELTNPTQDGYFKLDSLFESLRTCEPNNVALSYYERYKCADINTLIIVRNILHTRLETWLFAV